MTDNGTKLPFPLQLHEVLITLSSYQVFKFRSTPGFVGTRVIIAAISARQ